MSIFANNAFVPCNRIQWTALSTVAYRMEHSWGAIPLFTLELWGLERSRISHHFPGWPDFGITPNLLIWTSGMSGRGLTILPALSSVCKNSDTGWGFAMAEFMLLVALLHLLSLLKPILKPSLIPRKMYWTRFLSE